MLSVQHGDPVQAVLMLPGGGVMVTAGGNVMKIWDVLAGSSSFLYHGNGLCGADACAVPSSPVLSGFLRGCRELLILFRVRR